MGKELGIINLKGTGMEKNFGLLRKFDLKAALAGKPICFWEETAVKLVSYEPEAVPAQRLVLLTSAKTITLCHEDGTGCSTGCLVLFMAPLGWVEGKPVYEGDALYYKETGLRWGWSLDMADFADNWTWEKPKGTKTGWVPRSNIITGFERAKAFYGQRQLIEVTWEE